MDTGGRERGKPPFGLPERIVLVRRPEGWRHTTTTTDRTRMCGGLRGLSPDADVAEARAAAAAMLYELGREFHGGPLGVVWDEPAEPDSAAGRIHREA